ncbi:hypothetical protein ACFP6A_00035 [Quadrisphaera sp. GCM10027208]|uniref:hypothetical protein n=1 Tax=Quadrisphaera sp. GCM10027208 TaxID=3273423 RepID=UPI0036164BA2
MTQAAALVLRPLRSRSLWLTLWLLAVAMLAIEAWVWATDPDNRPWAPLILPFMYVLGVGMTMRVELTTDPPALTWRSPLAFWRSTAPLGPRTTVQLRGAGSTVSVHARADGRRFGVSVDVLAATEYVRRSRDPEELEALAKAVRGARGGHEVARQLRAQAAHVRAGGDVQSSPLAKHLGRTLLGLRY